ncbi:hypothetical protein GOODEAATRI_017723, partial [Goodea atripinnis]
RLLMAGLQKPLRFRSQITEAMTVPLRRLAGLWPWLLMAALQVVLGQPSLESERSGLRAVIKVTLVKEPTVEPIVLKGQFVGGSAGKAQGKLMQQKTSRFWSPPDFLVHIKFLIGLKPTKVFPPTLGCTECLLLTSFFHSLRVPLPVRARYLLGALFPGPQRSRLGTRDGRVEWALRDNIKVRPVPNAHRGSRERKQLFYVSLLSRHASVTVERVAEADPSVPGNIKGSEASLQFFISLPVLFLFILAEQLQIPPAHLRSSP